MRRFMLNMRGTCRRTGEALSRSVLGRMVGVLAIAGAASCMSAYAANQVENVVRSNDATPTARRTSQPEPVALPQCLKDLKLSTEQQTQIQGIIQNYDESMNMVWNQFGQRYMQTITMESSLLAAIEDNLTEGQRQQLRDQRRKTAKQEKAMASTSNRPNQAKSTKDEETTKPANAADEVLDAINVSLTDEQEAAADKLQEKYRSQLRSLNRDIQGMHTRLVSLEADKLVEIEKVLTKDQLTSLRKSRANAPEAPKMAISQSVPAKRE